MILSFHHIFLGTQTHKSKNLMMENALISYMLSYWGNIFFLPVLGFANLDTLMGLVNTSIIPAPIHLLRPPDITKAVVRASVGTVGTNTRGMWKDRRDEDQFWAA